MTGGTPSSAAAYDQWFDAPWGSYAFGVERDALLAALGPLTGRRVLDVGCGTGRFTAAFEQAGAHVVGLDRDAAMLAVAADRVAGPLLRADAHALPIADASADVTVAVTLLEFAAHAERVVDEMLRVTRPGGTVAVATLNPRSPWGLAHRRRLRQPPWRDACLLTRAELHTLLAVHGSVRLHGVLFSPGAFPGMARVGPVLEQAGRIIPALGAFQIAVLERPAHR